MTPIGLPNLSNLCVMGSGTTLSGHRCQRRCSLSVLFATTSAASRSKKATKNLPTHPEPALRVRRYLLRLPPFPGSADDSRDCTGARTCAAKPAPSRSQREPAEALGADNESDQDELRDAEQNTPLSRLCVLMISTMAMHPSSLAFHNAWLT